MANEYKQGNIRLPQPDEIRAQMNYNNTGTASQVHVLPESEGYTDTTTVVRNRVNYSVNRSSKNVTAVFAGAKNIIDRLKSSVENLTDDGKKLIAAGAIVAVAAGCWVTYCNIQTSKSLEQSHVVVASHILTAENAQFIGVDLNGMDKVVIEVEKTGYANIVLPDGTKVKSIDGLSATEIAQRVGLDAIDPQEVAQQHYEQMQEEIHSRGM